MHIKYKKTIVLTLFTLLFVSFLPAVSPLGRPRVEAAACIADNQSLCSCQRDSQGIQINCTSLPQTSDCNTSGCDLVGKYINPAIALLSILVGVVSVTSIIVAGIQYSTSGGDPQKVSAAKKRIAMTVFGLLAYTFLFAFLQFLVPGGLFNK